MTRLPRRPPFFRIGPERPGLAGGPLGAACRARLSARSAERRPAAARRCWRRSRTGWSTGWSGARRRAGATAFVARAPRAEIDLNRDEREIDPALVAPPLPLGQPGPVGAHPGRARPDPLADRRRRPDLARAHPARRARPAASRTSTGPITRRSTDALRAARDRFGDAMLLDCHSMPPRPRIEGGAGAATVIFGDRHGTTIDADLLDAAMSAARALGYSTACNAPYAGGYIVGRHGRPEAGASTRSRSRSTARSISTPICARPAPASRRLPPDRRRRATRSRRGCSIGADSRPNNEKMTASRFVRRPGSGRCGLSKGTTARRRKGGKRRR